KEVHGIERFQLIQHSQDRLELRLIAKNREEAFAQAKQAINRYLQQNDVTAEIYLTEELPKANPISGKYKHIVAKAGR
ncbi:MAG: phenylacetate--CoA ligase family protein, partial [Clostridia bacterium]